jgi:lipoate-protein ligase A
MIVYFDRTLDPAANLKRETELFEATEAGGPEAVRFWVNSTCLIRGEARSSRYGWYNEELAKEMGVPVLVRSTGGGVVYHDEGNLNWSFFLKVDGFVSPSTAFDRGSRHVIAALQKLGVRAVFAPPNRIDVSGRKVSGMAARSTRHTLLVHGTLLLNSDLVKLNRLCIPPPGCPPVANLSEWAKSIDAEAVVRAVSEVLSESGFQIKPAA